jgi:VWFA-related protein
MTSRVLTLMACMALVTSVPPVQARQRTTRERQVLISVLDKSDKIATGLTPADFSVREDGVAREVLRIEQTTTPMQVVLLVDTSGGTQLLMQDVRKGIQVMAGALWGRTPDTEISLMEFGERPSQLAEFSRSATLLDKGVGRLFEHTGSGAYLLEGIIDAAKALQKHAAKRPVIVVFTTEGSREFSSQTSQNVEESLKNAGNASLWAIELHSAGGSPGQSDEERQRNIVLGDVTAKSGGARDTVLDRMSIEPQFTKLADRLALQYTVTYSRPDSLIPPSKLEITATRPGLKVFAPKWSGQ